MLQTFKNGQTSVVLRAKLLDSSSTTGAGLTGLSSASGSLIISTIADNEATAVAYTVAGSTVETIVTLGTYSAPTATKCRFKEVDSTNHKGVYEFHFADARFAVASAKSLLVSVAGAANLQQAEFLIQLQTDDPYTAPLTAAAIATGVWTDTTAGDFTTALSVGKSVMNGVALGTGLTVNTVTNQLTAAAIATGVWTDTTAGDFTTALSVGKSVMNGVSLGTGLTVAAVSGAVGSVAAAGISRASFNADTGLQSIRSNTATAGAATTVTLDASASAVNDFYKNCLCYLTGGTGVGQSRFITGYVGATKVATVSTWATNPDNTSTFAIMEFDAMAGASAPTAAQVATAVWQDTTAGDFTTALSVGKSVMNGVALGTGLTINTVTNQLTAAQIATGVWTDTIAGDFTTALSVGKSVMNGVALGTGLTVNAVTGLTASNLDATISSRMATYVQPTGFLAATFPGGTVANTTNITSITGNITGNLSGSVGSVTARVTANTDQIDGIATSAANLSKSTHSIVRGTCSGGTTTTAVVSSMTTPASLAATGQLIGRTILFDDDTATADLQGQASNITNSSTGATPTITFTAMTTAPADTDTFSIV